MMKQYGTPATEHDVQRAQFLNYLRAPKPLQQAMQGLPHDSDAYRGVQNAMASAETDLGLPHADWSQPPAPGHAADPRAAQIVQQTASNLGANNPVMAMLNPQAEQERRQRRQQSQGPAPSASPVSYGSVNGQQMAVPTAGNYTNGAFQAAIGSVSPDLARNSAYGVDAGQLKNAQNAQQYLAAGLPVPQNLRQGNPSLGLASDIAGKAASRDAAIKQRDYDNKLKLETEPAKIKAGADRYAADQNVRANDAKLDREMQNLYRTQLGKHQHDVQYLKGRYDKELKTRQAISRAAQMAERNSPGNDVMLPGGSIVPKGEVEQYLLDKARLSPGGMPPMEEYASGLGYDLTPPTNPFTGGAAKAPATAGQPGPATPNPERAKVKAADPELSSIQDGREQEAYDKLAAIANNPQETPERKAEASRLAGKIKGIL